MKSSVLLKPFNNKIFYQNQVFNLNSEGNIFEGFREKLLRQEVSIETIDMRDGSNSDIYVYCDVPYPWEVGLWKDLISHPERNVLFCFESPLVNPFNHYKQIFKYFRSVHTWNDKLVGAATNIKKFRVPQTNSFLDEKPINHKDKKFLTMIAANKAAPLPFRLLSPYKENLYLKRVRILEEFNSRFPDKLDLYGRGWDKRPPKAFSSFSIKVPKVQNIYRGLLPQNKKIETLKNYKYSLCIENSGADGYITEKIFDAFKARCVPVYLGAPNVSNYIRQGTYIDMREFKDLGSLIRYLEEMTIEEYQNYIDNIEGFLSDPQTKKLWFEEYFEKEFIEAL